VKSRLTLESLSLAVAVLVLVLVLISNSHYMAERQAQDRNSSRIEKP
jgi:hypothetical protein